MVSYLPKTLRADRVAAPLKVILPSSTEIITSSPLVSEEKVSVVPLPILSEAVALKPTTESLPSPAAYSIKLLEPLMLMKSLPVPPLIFAFKPALIKESSPAPPLIETEEL